MSVGIDSQFVNVTIVAMIKGATAGTTKCLGCFKEGFGFLLVIGGSFFRLVIGFIDVVHVQVAEINFRIISIFLFIVLFFFFLLLFGRVMVFLVVVIMMMMVIVVVIMGVVRLENINKSTISVCLC